MAPAKDDEEEDESTYIFLDLTDLKPPINLKEGDTVQLKGLLSDNPELVLANGLRAQGKYEDSLGSQIFLEAATRAEEPGEGKPPEILGVGETTIVFTEFASIQDATKAKASKSQPKSKPNQSGSQPFSTPNMT